jgi:hypothetical protein
VNPPELWWSPILGVIQRRRGTLWAIGPDGAEQLSALPRNVTPLVPVQPTQSNRSEQPGRRR